MRILLKVVFMHMMGNRVWDNFGRQLLRPGASMRDQRTLEPTRVLLFG